jgi:hypothetical protein
MSEKIKDYIVKCLNENDDITMNGLQSQGGFNEITSGKFSWTVSDKNGNETNIIMMNNISQECIDSFIELIDNDIIKINPTSLLVAMVDGKTISVPIAKSIRKYKEPRWIPMLVEKSRNFKEY